MEKNVKVVRVKKDAFRMIELGRRNYVIRPLSEGYHSGDTIMMREYDCSFTGKGAIAEILSICAGELGLNGGYQIVSFGMVRLCSEN